MKLADHDILQILKSGGPDVHKAMDYLYVKSRKKIISHVIKNGGSKEDGQDIVQDTLIAFYTNVLNNKFRHESEIGGYLFGIARNKWLKVLKSKERLRKFKNHHKTQEVNEEPEIINTHLLKKVMEKIDDNCRELLIHSFYFNYSADEIRSKFEFKNEQVARNKKYKCLKKLRSLIAKHKIKLI